MLDVRRYPLISDQVDYAEISVIVREAYKSLNKTAHGSFVEFGCYSGTTSLFLQRVLIDDGGGRQLHVYDSFEGLPGKTVYDNSPAGEQFVAGELRVGKRMLINNFKHAGLPQPIIHKLWFDSITANDLPESIAFAYMDGDFYSSIADSLKAITIRLVHGAIIVIDDYHTEALPGVKKATDRWATQYGLPVQVEQSLAIVRWSP